MKLALFCYSRQGRDTACRVLEAFPDWEVRKFAPERYAEDGFQALKRPPRPFYGDYLSFQLLNSFEPFLCDFEF